MDVDQKKDQQPVQEQEEPEMTVKKEPARKAIDEAKLKELKERSVKYQKCPICNEEIPIEDMEEHMRIELMDPKAKLQRQTFLDRQRESSLAPASDISAYLNRIARKRSDIFIDTDDEKTKKRKDADEKKNQNNVAWDGFAATKSTVQASAIRFIFVVIILILFYLF